MGHGRNKTRASGFLFGPKDHESDCTDRVYQTTMGNRINLAPPGMAHSNASCFGIDGNGENMIIVSISNGCEVSPGVNYVDLKIAGLGNFKFWVFFNGPHIVRSLHASARAHVWFSGSGSE